MRRGFTGGLIWGIAAAIFCLFCLIAYQSMQPEESPDATSLEVPAGSEFNQSREDNSINRLAAISTADRAKIVQSNLVEPNPGLDVDRTIGSSAKTPVAESTNLSRLENKSSNSSKMAIQRPASLAEKPTFTARNIQKPIAPRAEGALSFYSGTAMPLPKEEILLEQKIDSKVPQIGLEVSVDPSGPSFGMSSNINMNVGFVASGEKIANVTIPQDETALRTQFSELEMQIAPQLPDANLSGMMSDNVGNFGSIKSPNQNLSTELDAVQKIDFSALKENNSQSQFSNPDVSLSPKFPKPIDGEQSNVQGPKMQSPEMAVPESSQLSNTYTGSATEDGKTHALNQVSNSFLLIEPQQSGADLIIQDQAIKPKAIEQDLSVTAFGSKQAKLMESDGTAAAQKFEGGKDDMNGVTKNLIIDPSSLATVTLPNLEQTSPITSKTLKTQASEQTPLSASETKNDLAFSATLENNKPRPIEAFSVPGVPQDGKPLLAIVLIIDEKYQIDLQALKDIPFPLTIAVSSNSSNSEEIISHYRSKGFEVAIVIDYPPLSSQKDIEAILVSSLSLFDKTVAVIEGRPGSFQKTRARSEQIAKILSQSGHGLLIHEKGLNTIVQTANKLAVPVSTIYRNLDQLGSDSRKIRRFLDGAAFRARQSGDKGAVVVTAGLRPETLGALLIWSIQDKSKSVVLAPLSQALMIANDPY